MSGLELNTPVAFVIFNRPAHTRRVFDVIAAVRPRKLFIIADGPRPHHPTDVERCRNVRAIVQNVTWPCDVRMDFADVNLGCRDRTISGTNWVFSQVDEAIFLEDDTLPDPSFFRFCQELLQRFRDDCRVMTINGICLDPRWSCKYSYGFSALHCSWGRALWRRSWERFDPAMKLWPEFRDEGLMSHVFPNPVQAAYWRGLMDSTYRGRFDAWDYPFMLSCWMQSGLAVVPGRNLVRNIGFGPDSTHTKVDDGSGKVPVREISFPLRHPPIVLRDRAYEDFAHKKIFHRPSLPVRARNKLIRIWQERRLQRMTSQTA